MQFDNLPDSAVGFSNLLLAIGGVCNMTNLAENWDQWTEHERDMMLTALDWHRRVQGQPAINVGLLPFVPKAEVLKAVQSYIQSIVFGTSPDSLQWSWLANRIKNVPYLNS